MTSAGTPDAGWLLFLYAANSSTPVTSFKDTALTAGLENPWPIQADSTGMMPSFWLADGSYRARATSNDGSRTIFDLPSILALGASTGSAPSGGVDPNAIWQTGDTMWLDVSGTRAGWVRDNGRTLGSATSGASERANLDCQSLFEYLWNNYSDTLCPVVTGRGVSAAADWGANKQITLPDKRGKLYVGLDDMGNSAASAFTGVPFSTGDATTAGSLGGEATHALLTAELASHTHTATVTDPEHAHLLEFFPSFGSNLNFISGAGEFATGHTAIGQTNNAATGITVANSNTGSGTAHNNMQSFVTATCYRKL